jgi:hypothetical protein
MGLNFIMTYTFENDVEISPEGDTKIWWFTWRVDDVESTTDIFLSRWAKSAEDRQVVMGGVFGR